MDAVAVAGPAGGEHTSDAAGAPRRVATASPPHRRESKRTCAAQAGYASLAAIQPGGADLTNAHEMPDGANDTTPRWSVNDKTPDGPWLGGVREVF